MKSSRKSVFDGRLLKVFKGRKILPDGTNSYFEEIDHPGASLIVPYAAGRIILIRQYRAVIGKYIWELPAGTLDAGETPYACAKREVAEETGYKVRTLKKIGVIYTTPGFCNERIHVFKAECGRREKSNMDEGEIIRIRHFRVSEIRRLFDNGKINDSKTIAGLSFAGIL